MAEPIYHPWAPRGGMNQDDSLINNSPGLASSLFESGDYRYARNVRINASHGSNSGDIENIRGTLEVTDYWAKQRITDVENFNDLSAWEESSAGWSVSAGVLQYSMSTFVQVTPMLFKPLPGSSSSLDIEFSVRAEAGDPPILNPGDSLDELILDVVFLKDGAELSSTGFTFPTDTGSFIDRRVQVSVPQGATHIGLRVRKANSKSESIFIEADVEVNYFNISYTQWQQASRPQGNEKVIGKYSDRETMRLYYAVYNDQGNHCLRYWNPSDGRIYEMLRWSGLKFGPNYFVKMAKLDNWLTLTDRNNRPRLIDVDTITDLALALGSDFREFHISFHKWAPLCPPIVKTFFTAGQYKFRGKGVFQFSYRYIYYGGLRSRYSPVSAAVPMQEVPTSMIQYNIRVHLPGVILDDPDADVEWNYFGHDSEKFRRAVEYIEIAFRRGTTDIWKVWKRVRTDELPEDLQFDFYNTEVDSVVATDDFFQPFDAVPFKAGTVEAIDNRFVFADCLDELPLAEAPQVVNVSVKKVSNTNHWNSDNGFSGMSAADQSEYVARNLHKKFSFKARGMYKICIQYFDYTGWRSLGNTAFNMSYLIDAVPATSFPEPHTYFFNEPPTALEFSLPSNFKPPKDAVAYQVMRSNCINIEYFMEAPCNGFDYLIDDPTDLKDFVSAPDFVKSSISQYFDNDNLVTATEFNDAVVEGTIRSDDFLMSGIRDKLAKKAKTNPMTYRMLLDRRKTKTTPTLESASRIYIDINNWVNAAKQDVDGNKNWPMNNLFYDYRRGDRVRFVGSDVTNPGSAQKKIYDAVILEYTGKALIVAKPNDLKWLPKKESSAGPGDFFIEVYRPKTEIDSDFLFYEVGEWYPVLHPLSESRDWSRKSWVWKNTLAFSNNGKAAVNCTTYGSGASAFKVFENVPFFLGDCHLRPMQLHLDFPPTLGAGLYISMNPFTMGNDEVYEKALGEDDRTLAWERAAGRAVAAYTTIPQIRFKPTQARFGGQIIEESLVNNVNRFRPEDQKVYPSEYGRIRYLIQVNNQQVDSVGSILLAIGEREAWSIYVNRTTIEDLSGRTQVALSTRVLGSFNTLLGSHGTLNPESVAFNRGRVYWWDALNGTWVRYGRDGLTALSKYKMRGWFKDLGQLLSPHYHSDEIPLAISGYDPRNEMLVTRQDHSGLPATFRGYSGYKGATFSEDDVRWKDIHDLDPEMFADINDQMVSFKEGSLFLHEQTDEYNTFYGTKYDSYIEPVFNPAPKENKVWESINIVSTDGWSVERIIGEYRGASRLIQQSVIPLDNFEAAEDMFWAAILSDQNTVNVDNPIIEGDKMRGKAIQVLLKLDPEVTTLSLLHFVEVGYILSPKVKL